MKKVLLVLAIVGMFLMPPSFAGSTINEDGKDIKNIFTTCIEKDILPDIEEIYKNKPNVDSDKDGLTDLYELKTGTSPFNPDCDNDGIPDGKDNTPIKTINLGLYRKVKAGEVFNIDATKIHPNAFRYYWDLDYKCEGYEDMGNNLSHWFMKAGEHEIKLVAIDKDLTPTHYLLTINVEPSNKVTDTKTDWDPTVNIEVTVNIKRLKCYDSVDWGTAADMYVKVYIYNTWKKSSVFHKNDNDVSPNWHCTVNVPDDQENTPIKIQVWDDDVWWDDKLDIDPTNQGDSKTLELTYSVKSGSWSGEDHIGDSTGYGFSKSTGTSVDAGAWFRCYQNDYDNDNLTYWEENNVYDTNPQVTNKKYAILISGGYSRNNNHARYWNDLYYMYKILITYGFTEGDIYVLYADGNTPSAANCNDPENIVETADIIDYSATTNNLRAVFNILSNKMTANDLLFIYSTDHGGYIDSNDNGRPDFGEPALLYLWGESIRDDVFAGANYLGKITHYKQIIVVMEQCYSGGFIGEVSRDSCVVITACENTEESWACDTEGHYDEFVYHFQNALSWRTPYWSDYSPVDADSNNDGYISMNEAFVYASNHDSQPETPQLDDDGNGLSQEGGDSDDGDYADSSYVWW